ncbi:Ryanodine receptor 1, partial [Corvus brachyrhynchos]
ELISQTMVHWAQESFIQSPALVRAMFSLLSGQYDALGELGRALPKAYAISATSVPDTTALLECLGQIRSLLIVQMGPEEENLMIQSIGCAGPGPLGPPGSPCVPSVPPLCPSVPPLCPPGSPLCPPGSPLCPLCVPSVFSLCPPVSPWVPLCPSVSLCVPLCPLCVPHVLPVSPLCPLCVPSVSPLCPLCVTLCPPCPPCVPMRP